MAVSAVRRDARRRLYLELEPAARTRRGLSTANRIVCGAILLATLAAVLETEPDIVATRAGLFTTFEWGFTLLFALEYAARVWVSAENPRYGPGLRGRLRYVRSPAAILDLLATAPVLLAFTGSEALLLRLFRLARILRLAQLGRFSRAVRRVSEAVRSRRHELAVSACLAGALLVVSSTLLYLTEGRAQPEGFGSIPRAMWWSVATLTTVGYGDVYPITALGRVLAGLTAVTGIGLVAMPAGILAAAFSDALERQRRADEQGEDGSGGGLV